MIGTPADRARRRCSCGDRGVVLFAGAWWCSICAFNIGAAPAYELEALEMFADRRRLEIHDEVAHLPGDSRIGCSRCAELLPAARLQEATR